MTATKVFTVQPIIIRSDRDPAHEVYEAFNQYRLQLMDWWQWYARGKFAILILDPLRAQVTPPQEGWNHTITGGLWYQVRQQLYNRLDQADVILVMLEDVEATDTYGSGLKWWGGERNYGLALVDSRVCQALRGVPNAIRIDGNPPMMACGVIQHEIGHGLGLKHTDTPEKDIMYDWYFYPNVLLQELELVA